MQDVAGMLDAILGCLLWGGEAVVSATMEVLEAAGAVLQFIRLAWHDGLLLRHTEEEERKPSTHKQPASTGP